MLSEEMIRKMVDFDGVIVPSDWCQSVFSRALPGKIVEVVPLGIDPETWHQLPRESGSEIFRIIWQGTFCGDRKGAPLALKVFNDLNLPYSELILKMNPRYTDAKIEWDLWLDRATIADILQIPERAVNDIRVHSLGRLFCQEDMTRLLAGCHLSLYPSYGEGFGLIPLEHMATGLPVIMADNSGMSMFADPRYNWPIPCTEKCSTFGPECGVDYAPDENEIKRAILWTYEHRDQAVALGQAAAKWVRENWTYRHSAEKFLSVIERMAA